VRDIVFPSLTRVYWSSSHDFTIDTAHLIHGLSAHAPHLDDLTICCARFKSPTPSLVSPIVSLKRYALHNWDSQGSMAKLTSSGWSGPFTTGGATYFAQEYSDCRLLPLGCILLQNMTFKLRRELLGIA